MFSAFVGEREGEKNRFFFNVNEILALTVLKLSH